MEIKVAMVETWILLSSISRLTKLKEKQTILMKPKMAHAVRTPLRESSASRATLMFPKTTPKNLKMLSLRDQSLLLLKQTLSSSNSTMVVSSAAKDAVPTLIMVFSLLGMALIMAATTGS